LSAKDCFHGWKFQEESQEPIRGERTR
jgi:hypothetical protein